MRQSELKRTLESDQVAVDAQVEGLAARLSEAQLLWQPPDGGWSVGQVFEHLTVSAESYTEPFTRLVARGTPAASGDSEWKPSWFGGWLTGSLRKEGNRLPAPKIYRVGPKPRPGVIPAFLAIEKEMAELRDRAAGLDWRRARLSSPPLPILSYNLGDAFTILVVHAQRHLRQVGRVMARPGFPGA